MLRILARKGNPIAYEPSAAEHVRVSPDSAALASSTRCRRCGGGHASRERCLLDTRPYSYGVQVAQYRSALTRTRRQLLGSVLRWIAAIAATAILVGALIVAGIAIAALTQVDVRVGLTSGVLIGAIAAGLVASGLLCLTVKPYAAVVYCALALTLISGGLVMLVIAPVVRQVNTPDLAEYRGFAVLLWFGLLSTILGLALGAFCLHWSMQRNPRRALARWGRILGAVYGVVLALAGLQIMFALFGLIGGEATFDEAGNQFSVVEQAIAFTAITMWSLVPGIVLTYHCISAAMGEGSDDLRVPLPWLALLAFGTVVVAGQLNMAMDSPIAAPMPLLHALAAALPGITLVSMASRGSFLRGGPVRGVTWRQATMAAALAMSLAVVIAIYVESFGAALAVVLLLVNHGAFEAASSSEAVFEVLEMADEILSDNEQFVAGLITAAVLAPVSEEFAKSLGVRFLMSPNSTRAQCFLLGAIAGAGFGFLEAMLYGLGGISEDLADWWVIMVVRGGSTSLHVICSGLAGLGWWYWTIAGKHRTAVGLFTVAILIHAGWNAVFTAIDSRIFVLDTLSNRTIEVVAYSIVALVSGLMIVAVPLVARSLREPPSDAHAIDGLEPWMAAA